MNSNYKALHYADLSVDSEGVDAIMNNWIFGSQLYLSYLTLYKADLNYDSVQCDRNLLAFRMDLLFLSCSMNVQSLRFSEMLANFTDVQRNGFFSIIFWIRTTCFLDRT